MKKLKRFLSLALALCIILSVVPFGTFAADSSDDFDKIVHLDNGRKYYSADWIKALITEMSAAGFTQLQLAFGNDGLRFLLDDMSVTVNGTTYTDENVTAGIQVGNKAYYDAGDVNELTQAEMDEIIAHAQSKGIEIVPHLNMPGHMDAILDAIEYVGISDAHFTGYTESARSLNLNNETAIAFTQALLEKYVAYFAGKGCNYFHIGADEFANDAYGGSMGFAMMGSSLYSTFVTFVQNCAEIVKEAGMTPRAWNDGFYYGSYTTDIDTDIQLTYWSSGWGAGYDLESASSLSSYGYDMINTNGDYYYILGVNDCYTSGSTTTHVGYDYTAAESFSNTAFMGSAVSDPVGSMFCIWADNPGAETETEVAKYIRPILRVMAARMSGSSSYEVESVVSGGFNADGSINTTSTEPDTTVSAIPNVPTTMTVGDTATLSVGESATWTSSNESVISLTSITRSATGESVLATAEGVGTATITATTDSGTTYSSDITVTAADTGDTTVAGEDTITSTGGGIAYELDTDGIDAGEEYVIVNTSTAGTGYALTNNSSNTPGSTTVIISDGKITNLTEATDDNVLWTISGTSNATVKNGSYYVYLGNNSVLSTSSRNLTISSQGNGAYRIYRSGNSTYYLRYNNNNSWQRNSSAGNVYLFQKVDATAYTIDAALQESRINSLTVTNDGYTDETWSAYQSALTAAQTKLAEVEAATYTSETAANTALNELIAAVDALETAKNALAKAVTITIKYVTADGTVVKTETRNVSEKTTSVTVANFNANNKFYVVSNTTLAITPATVTTYNVTVTETAEDLSDVDPLTIEYWITNQVVTIDNATSISIAADKVYGEAGVDFSTLVPATDGAAENAKIFWKGWLLPTGYHQEVSGSDMTTNENGALIEKIRYWNGAWQYYNGTEWADIQSSDQVVAYYLQQTKVTTEVTTNVVDWGQDYAEWKEGVDNSWFWDGYVENGSKYVFLDFAVVYEDGTQNPSSFPTDNTWFFHFDGCSATNPRVLGAVNFTESEGYEIWKITITDGTSSGYSSASTFTSTYDDTTETVVWDESMGGEPHLDSITYTANRSGKLVRVYVRAVATEDTLNVVYYDEKFGDTLYTYSINVNSGVIFSNDYFDPDPTTFADNAARIDVSNAGIENALGVTQYFKTDLTKVPEAVGKYNSDLYKYTGSKISTDGKTLYLYYNIDQTALSPNFVADFGLPITFSLSDVVKSGIDTVTSVTVNENTRYGTLSYDADKKVFTYTPTTVLPNIDVLTINILFDGQTAATTTNVGVTPATTVYYEEGFAELNGFAVSGTSTATSQTTQILGSSSDAYGYDGVYADDNGYNGTQATSGTVGSTATFTFTGTGIDIYANCDTTTGVVAVIIKNAAGTIEKFYQVDTIAANGDTTATNNQNKTLNSLPIVSVDGLTHGEHTVTIMHVNRSTSTTAGSVHIDGFRVYGTLASTTVQGETSVYYKDKEDAPVYYELRDMVLNAIGVSDTTSNDYTTMVDQVYNAVAGASAIITDEKVTYGDSNTIQDLLDNGPKNELFLYAGQTLTFKVTTNRVMQIGLKAPAGSADIVVKVGETAVNITNEADFDNVSTISTSTDMFYQIADKATTSTTYTITITNNGSNILSVTDLKICDDPNASFEALTAEDIELALKAMGYSDVTYADAALTVPVVDYTGKELTSVTLTANGVVGESAVFTAEQILTAVKEALPEGYGLVDESKVADVTVAYGESASASVQAGKTVTLTIKFISARNGKRVDTAEITLVQSSAKNWTRVSAAQIKALAPEGYRAFWMVNMTLVYGKDATIVVPVY